MVIEKYRIKYFLSRKDITYNELANDLGVTTNTIAEWVKLTSDDKRSIPGDFLLAISDLFRVKVEQLHNPDYLQLRKKIAA